MPNSKNNKYPFTRKYQKQSQCMHFAARKGDTCSHNCVADCAEVNADHYKNLYEKYKSELYTAQKQLKALKLKYFLALISAGLAFIFIIIHYCATQL